METAAARGALKVLRRSLARATSILTDGYRPSGRKPSEYDTLFVRQRRAALAEEIERLNSELSKSIDESLRGAARTAQTNVGRASGFPVAVDARVVAYARDFAATEVRAVTDAVRASVRRIITRSVAGGLTHGEMLRDIRKAIGVTTAARVERIARTETNRAYQQQGAAMDEQLSKLGVDLIKRWVAHLDDRTRETHLEVTGQERELGDLFNVGNTATEATPPKSRAGYKANRPLDPSLPPEESINCRCDVLYVRRSQAVQPYIRKAGKPSRIAPKRRVKASFEIGSRMLASPPSSRLLASSDARR